MEVCTDTGRVIDSSLLKAADTNPVLSTEVSTWLAYWHSWWTYCICLSLNFASVLSSTVFVSHFKRYFFHLLKCISRLFTEGSTCLASWHFHQRRLSSVCQHRLLGDDMTWTQHLPPTSLILCSIWLGLVLWHWQLIGNVANILFIGMVVSLFMYTFAFMTNIRFFRWGIWGPGDG